MSIARLLDVRHGDGIIVAPNLNQEHGVNWFVFLRHCASNGLCTIVASNWGSGGTGEQFHDQANPLGENAFIVARFDQGVFTFYVLTQWADAASFGTAPGNPGAMQGSTVTDGVGLQLAFREDGGDPWNGTSNDNGADTKGMPVWVPGGSTVHVFPRANNPGPPAGSYNTNKENCCRVGQDDVTLFSRAHWVANENGIFQLFSAADNGSYVGHYLGRYTPRTGLAGNLTFPYCQVFRDSITMWPFGSASVYGGLSGASADQGGIVGVPADGVMNLSISVSPSVQSDAIFQPNNLATTPEYEGETFTVFQRESVGGTLGLAGYLPAELLASFYNTNNQNTNAAGDRAYIGSTIIADRKWGISWDGGAVPGSNNTRTGRLSFTP